MRDSLHLAKARGGAMILLLGLLAGVVPPNARGDDALTLEVIPVWPKKAPGETTANTGTTLPRRPAENPPATRVKSITKPTLAAFLPDPSKRNGTAVIISPGGGYNYVVTDKEGSEAASWLNKHGVCCFVLWYRTKDGSPASSKDPALRPLQDIQRSIRLVRSRGEKLGINPERIGVLGFSAGGQLAALATTRYESPSYAAVDAVDSLSCRPNFAMLVYPWRLLDQATGELSSRFPIGESTPPTLLIHAHNDSATPLSSIQFYIAMKKLKRPAELHVYASGGHGYGMRAVENSDVDTWPQRATDWLMRRGLIGAAMSKKDE